MNIVRTAACAAALLSSMPAFAASATGDEPTDVDEVVVVGRVISTSHASIDVAGEMIVDTAAVLKDIPGANVNSNGPVTGIAQYRGMYGDRVSVAIDHLGLVPGGPNAMDAPLTYVSPMITDELSVTRGIPGVSVAPESIGGHVATRVGRGSFGVGADLLSGFVGTRFSGNGNVSTTAARLTLANDRHKVSLVAEADRGDDIETPIGTMRPSRLDRERSDLSYGYAGDRAAVLVFAGRLDTSETGTPALPMDIRYIETDLAGAQLQYAVSTDLSLRARAAWNDVAHLMDNFGLRQPPMAAMYRRNLATGSGGHLNLEADASFGSSELVVGFDGVRSSHDATITNPNNAAFSVANFSGVSRDLDSLFAEWRYSADRSDLEFGLRAKRVTAAAGEVGAAGMDGMMGSNVAALAAAFNAANRGLEFTSVDVVARYRHVTGSGAEWQVEIGSKTRAPSYQELYLWLPLQATGGLADGRSYIGGLALSEERSNEIVAGFGAVLGRLTMSPQVYYRRIDDYIQGVPSDNMLANVVSRMMSGAPALEFRNVDAEIWGADVAWKLELDDHWFVDGIISSVRGKRRDVDDNLYRLAPANASLGVNWNRENLAITTEIVAYARQDEVSAFNGELSTPGYELVNMTLTWHPTEALRIEARLDNLFDETYQDHLAGINRAAGSDIPVGERLYGAERTLSAGLVFSF